MSLKTLIAIAGVIAGTLAFGDSASAQIVTTSPGGYYTPGVVTTSYYTPATSWSYYGSPVYYGTPYVSSYYSAPIYGYSYPYYGGYYGGVYNGLGPRRWWWR
jgi:hypothetical protein